MLTGCTQSAAHLGSGQTCNLMHVEREHAHTHKRLCNEIHPFKMHSLPDRDNIKPGLGRGKGCHTSLGGLGYRKDPLLRPFITKHCIYLWGSEAEQEQERGWGGWFMEKRKAHKGRWQNLTGHHVCALPPSFPSHPSALLCQCPRPIWWTSCLLINVG